MNIGSCFTQYIRSFEHFTFHRSFQDRQNQAKANRKERFDLYSHIHIFLERELKLESQHISPTIKIMFI